MNKHLTLHTHKKKFFNLFYVKHMDMIYIYNGIIIEMEVTVRFFKL